MPAAALLSTVTGLLSPRPPAANDQQEEEEQGERPPLTLPLVGAGPQESFASCASEWADARAEFEEGDAAATATAAAGKQQQPPAAMAAAAPAAAADDDDGDGHDGRVRPLPLPGAVPAVPDSPSSSPAPSLDGSEAGLNISPLPSTRQPPPPPSMETDVAAGVSPLSTDGWVVVAGDDDGDAASVGSALSFSTAMGEEEEEEEEREYVDRWGFVIRPDDPRASRLSRRRRTLALLRSSTHFPPNPQSSLASRSIGGGGKGRGPRSSLGAAASVRLGGVGGEEREELRRWRREVQKETSRATKWLAMLRGWGQFASQKRKRRVRKGIPDAVRRQAWGLLVGLPEAMAQQPTLYDSLLQKDWLGGKEGGEEEEKGMKEVLDTIERDVDRTFPRHVLFREHGGEGQNRLRRVLRAYARLDTDVGYCQGMGFVAAMLLTYFPEEEAFHMLALVMRGPRPAAIRGIYLPGMPKAREMLFVADHLTRRHLPKLHRHLMQQGVDNSMFLTQWFVTLFTNCFPFEVVTRVWDCFLAEGWKVLYRVQLAILTLHDKELRKREFEGIMDYVKGIPPSLDAPELLALAFRLPLKRKEIAFFEAEFERLHQPSLRVDI